MMKTHSLFRSTLLVLVTLCCVNTYGVVDANGSISYELILDANGGTNTELTRYPLNPARYEAHTVFNPLKEGFMLESWNGSFTETSTIKSAVNFISNYQGYECSSPVAKTFNNDINDRVEVDTLFKFKDNLTVNMWAYMDNWSDFKDMRLISCMDAGGWAIYSPESNKISFRVRDKDKTGGEDYVTIAGRLGSTLASGWHMFTLTFDGSSRTMTGYIDGESVGSKTINASVIKYNNDPITIGAEPQNGSFESPFKGQIRNVAIMNTAISKYEVAHLYRSPGITRFYYPGDEYDRKLVAKWTQVTVNTRLTAHANKGLNTFGGREEVETIIREANTSVVIPNPVRVETIDGVEKGYVLDSWNGVDNTGTFTTGHTQLTNYQGFAGSSPDAIYFDGEDTGPYKYRNIGKNYMYPDKITVNLWAYMDDWNEMNVTSPVVLTGKETEEKKQEKLEEQRNGSGRRLISCAQNGGWDIRVQEGKFQFFTYTTARVDGTSPHVPSYKYVTISSNEERHKAKYLSKGWHMFTLKFDGQHLYGYIDGVQVAKTEQPFDVGVDGRRAIKYHEGNDILLGADAHTGKDKIKDWHQEEEGIFAHCRFKGWMRNVAIMNDDLTAAEIRSLYANQGENIFSIPKTATTIIATWQDGYKLTVDPVKEEGGVNTTQEVMNPIYRTQSTALTINKPTNTQNREFRSWGGDLEGSKYISNYQGYECSQPEAKTFNGTSDFVAINDVSFMYEDKITVNLWAQMEDWTTFGAGTNGMRLISCAHGGGWDIEPHTSGCFTFLLHLPNRYDGSTDMDYVKAYSNHNTNDGGSHGTNGNKYYTTDLTTKKVWWKKDNPTASDIVLAANSWHMFTFTFDGQSFLGYIDGILVAKHIAPTIQKISYRGGTRSNNNVINDFSTTNGIFIGAEAGTNSSTPESGKECYFDGQIKNVSIIHAALPSYEINELYQTPGVARYYFPNSNQTLKAVWSEEDVTITQSVLTIEVGDGETQMEKRYDARVVGTSVDIINPVHPTQTFTHWVIANSDNTDEQIFSRYTNAYQNIEGKKVHALVINDPTQDVTSENAEVIFHGMDEVIFDGNTYYDLGREYMYEDALTVNVWAYMDDWDDYYGMRIISCTDDGGWGFESSTVVSRHINFKGYDNNTGYKDAKNTGFSYMDLEAGWHMFTLTFDGMNMRGYVDGKLEAISEPYASGYLGYHKTNHILLGAEPDGTQRDGNATGKKHLIPFKGRMRNLTIMNAAMTEEDVKALYNNPTAVRAYIPTSYTLKAEWTPNENTSVTVNANGGINMMADNNPGITGAELTVEQPVRVGHKFQYWKGVDKENDKPQYLSVSTYNGIQGKKIALKTSGNGLVRDADNSENTDKVLFRGNRPLEFDGKTCYDLGTAYKYTDSITVNVWAYMDDWDDFSTHTDDNEASGNLTHEMRLFSATATGGFNIEDDDYGHIRFSGYDSKKYKPEDYQFAGEYSTAVSSTSWSSLNNKDQGKDNWHMFTYVFDGSRVRGYLDGELIATSERYVGPMGYDSDNSIILGAEAGGKSDPETASGYHIPFVGKMKNFAIMHAALTPSQVAALYADPNVPHHYFHKEQTSLTAQWTENLFYVLDWRSNGLTIDVASKFGDNPSVVITDEENDTTILESTTLQKNATGHYDIQVDNLKDYYGKYITLTFTGNGNTGFDEIEVPYVLESVEDATDYAGKAEDYHVYSKNAITHPSAQETVKDLTVTSVGGGQHTINSSIKANTVYFISEGDEVPHLVIPDGTEVNLETAMIYFVKRIPADRFYLFSLPFDCKISDINFWDGSAVYDTHWAVYEYNGDLRASEGNNYGFYWRHLEATETIYAGRGYEIGVDAPAGETRDLIIPMKLNKLQLHELENAVKDADITAHGVKANTVAPNHQGWNLLGNPYFTSYGTVGSEGALKSGGVDVGANQWIKGDDVYVNIPKAHRGENGFSTYTQARYNDASVSLLPFSVFFIQAGLQADNTEKGKFTFKPNLASASYLAPRKMQSEEPQPRAYVGVSFSDETYSDATSLVVSNQFTSSYEVGADLEKMLGLGSKPQVYVHDANYKYAFKALSEAEASGRNALGVYFPAKGEYTFALKEDESMSCVQKVYLEDKERNMTVNLMQSPYTVSVEESLHITDRFFLSVVMAPQVATDLENTLTTSWAIWQDAPLQIRVEGLQVGEQVRIFDSLGHLVGQLTMKAVDNTFVVPTEGVYCVQSISNEGIQTQKIIVK